MGWRDRVRAVTAHLRATWVPRRARHYRRAGGPWQVPTLDALLSGSGGGGEVVDGATRLSAGQVEALVASGLSGVSPAGPPGQNERRMDS